MACRVPIKIKVLLEIKAPGRTSTVEIDSCETSAPSTRRLHPGVLGRTVHAVLLRSLEKLDGVRFGSQEGLVELLHAMGFEALRSKDEEERNYLTAEMLDEIARCEKKERPVVRRSRKGVTEDA